MDECQLAEKVGAGPPGGKVGAGPPGGKEILNCPEGREGGAPGHPTHRHTITN